MFALLGICLALAALFTLNALASLAAAAIWRSLKRPVEQCAASTRAATLFALRISPPAISLVCVLALLIPTYIEREPRTTQEAIGVKLILLALISCAGIGLAVWKGLAAWRATSRLIADWMRHAEPIRLPGLPMPAYLLQHSFPVIAVVGVLRPRLFIASQVFGALSHEEIAAAIAHESGHICSRDNLKRALLRACHDTLTVIPWGRSLEREWAQASEASADEYAARAGTSVALDLASALVKIARLAPASARPAMPAGAFLIGDSEGGVEWRVHRLLMLATAQGGMNNIGDMLPRLIIWGGLSMAVIVPLAVIAAASPQVLATTHAAIEFFVAALG
ncbi:MAG: M56 family metallopeptidase [Acidobacteria bacterium]|nr:M56 family metallopeptidase [Acidobacteriota bacterium]